MVEKRQSLVNSGRVSEDWKTANVTPLVKKEGRQKAVNYRPLNLTSVVGKMPESITKEEITNHLGKLNINKPSRHGFLKSKLHLGNLLGFFEDVTEIVGKGNP